MDAWIIFTLMAAFMQSIRTAGQKKISVHLSPMATTLVRYLFGLPVAVVYLLAIMRSDHEAVFLSYVNNAEFFIYASLASVAQILATFFLVKAMGFRNFAVATILSKTEAIQTAIFGAIFFSAFLSWLGWRSIMLGVAGIIVMSFPPMGARPELRGISYGVLSGLGFAFTALWLRQASLSLDHTVIQSAAITLVYTIIVQTIMCLIYLVIKEISQFSLIKKHIPLAIFVGVTSALGSVGWYTAMTYENAALVRSLGQIEIVFSLIITYVFFNEKIETKEYVGISAIVVSILILLLFL